MLVPVDPTDNRPEDILREWLLRLGWLETEMAETNESVLERFAVQAIAGGANTLKIEYDEGYEFVLLPDPVSAVSTFALISSIRAGSAASRATVTAARTRSGSSTTTERGGPALLRALF
jgi:hypothetical protein